MKTTKLTKTMGKLISITLLLAILSWGCQKRNPANEYGDIITTSEDFSRQANTEDENWRFVEGAYVDADYIQRMLNNSDCPQKIWSANGDTLTLRFGTGNTPCNIDGHSYLGTIISTHSGTPQQPGFTIHITTDDFSVDGNAIENIQTIVLDHFESNGTETVPVYHVTSECHIRFSTGEEISQTGTLIMKKLMGTSTPNDRSDDVYSKSGSGQGVNRKGEEFTYEIPESDPIIIDKSCKWFKGGKVSILMNAGDTSITIDFGYPHQDQCDNKAEINVNNGEYTTEINLN